MFTFEAGDKRGTSKDSVRYFDTTNNGSASMVLCGAPVEH